jgi:hypothetical protein
VDLGSCGLDLWFLGPGLCWLPGVVVASSDQHSSCERSGGSAKELLICVSGGRISMLVGLCHVVGETLSSKVMLSFVVLQMARRFSGWGLQLFGDACGSLLWVVTVAARCGLLCWTDAPSARPGILSSGSSAFVVVWF